MGNEASGPAVQATVLDALPSDILSEIIRMGGTTIPTLRLVCKCLARCMDSEIKSLSLKSDTAKKEPLPIYLLPGLSNRFLKLTALHLSENQGLVDTLRRARQEGAVLHNLKELSVCGRDRRSGLLDGLPYAMPNLTELRLVWSFPANHHLEFLSKFGRLETLDLSHSYFGEGLDVIGGLTQLRSLDISNTNVDDGITRSLSGLLNLTALDLSLTNIGRKIGDNVRGLGKLKALTMRVTCMSPSVIKTMCKHLTQLESLDLSDCAIGRSDLCHLVLLHKLESLNVSGCSSIVLPALSTLKRLTAKRMISVSGCLKRHEGLIELDVTDSDVSQSDINRIGKLQRLKKVEPESVRLKLGWHCVYFKGTRLGGKRG